MIQTLCPACGTTFRVTPEQLKVKQGKVRCGKCQHVFNAIETLHDAMAEPAGVSQFESQPEFDAMEDALAEMEAEAPSIAAPLGESQEEGPWQEIGPPQPAESEPARSRAWPWALASLLTLLFLTLQLSMHYRVELSVLAPSAKPMLLALCKPFDCDLPLPHLSDLVSIESSDLHPDVGQKDQLVLAATLKNRAPFAQAYPHLELTLTDTLDKAILRKVLVPAEYLAKEASSAGGFAGNSEIAVNLALKYDNAENVPATGYRLYLFYP
ncbi:MAG: DUF3426 domain-containing protein [Rhodocyclaceae bacterium]|nr:MAG: DUF3426 domain-containing protein [Rhodocyclaceae bacterium]